MTPLSDADQRGIAASLWFSARFHPNANVAELSGIAARVGTVCWQYYTALQDSEDKSLPAGFGTFQQYDGD